MFTRSFSTPFNRLVRAQPWLFACTTSSSMARLLLLHQCCSCLGCVYRCCSCCWRWLHSYPKSLHLFFWWMSSHRKSPALCLQPAVQLAHGKANTTRPLSDIVLRRHTDNAFDMSGTLNVALVMQTTPFIHLLLPLNYGAAAACWAPLPEKRYVCRCWAHTLESHFSFPECKV